MRYTSTSPGRDGRRLAGTSRACGPNPPGASPGPRARSRGCGIVLVVECHWRVARAVGVIGCRAVVRRTACADAVCAPSGRFAASARFAALSRKPKLAPPARANRPVRARSCAKQCTLNTYRVPPAGASTPPNACLTVPKAIYSGAAGVVDAPVHDSATVRDTCRNFGELLVPELAGLEPHDAVAEDAIHVAFL